MAIVLRDRPQTFALALDSPVRLSGLTDSELSRRDLAVATNLRAVLGKVRVALQYTRGPAHAEQPRELRRRAEDLKRAAEASERSAVCQGA
jgi:hypothetical protein